MFVKGASDLPEFYQDIVTDELNVKEIELTDDVRAFTSYTFKPQLKTVGPKYGKLLGGIKNELSNLDGNAYIPFSFCAAAGIILPAFLHPYLQLHR